MKRPTGELFKALADCNIDYEQVRLGGPPVDNVAIDEEGERTLIRLAGLSGLLGLGLAWWSLRSIKLTMIVFACGLISAASAMAIVWLCGQNMDAILLSMPSLVYVLAISGAVHLVNYYRDAVREHGPQHAVMAAVKHAWKPALLCSITTAFGLGSLYWSELAPIRNFGLYSAIGVLGLFVVVFAALPAALQLFFASPLEKQLAAEQIAAPVTERPKLVVHQANGGGKTKKQKGKKPRPSQTAQPLSVVAAPTVKASKTKREPRTAWERFWGHFSLMLVRRYWAVSIVSTLFIVGVSYGLTRVKTSIDLLNLFDEDARLLQDYRWFEAKLGPLIPLEIVLKVPTALQREHAGEADIARKPTGEAGADDNNQVASNQEIPLIGPGNAQADKQPERVIRANPEANVPFNPLTLSFLERVEVVEFCQRLLESRHGDNGSGQIGRSMSAATFVPILPEPGGGFSGTARRSVTNKRLWAQHQALIDSGYLRYDNDDETELWRISLRAAAFKDVDYQELLRETQDTLQPILLAQQVRRQVTDQWTKKANARPNSVVTMGINIVEGGFADMSEQNRTAFRVALRHFLMNDGMRVEMDTRESDAWRKGRSSAAFANIDLTRPIGEQVDVTLLTAESDLSQLVASSATGDQLHLELDPKTSISATFTGIVPIVYKAQRELLKGLIESTLWSFLTITPLMMFVCRSFLAGCVVMLPNALPVLVVFGGMGWLNIDVDIGSMMAASIALGVAVDDTIHYLAWFKDDLKQLKNRRRAILAAYRRCLNPTLQSALISGLGLSVFAFSTFTPTQRFGWLMLTILIAGVVAELFMLPALLAGPLGRVFKVPPRDPPEPPATLGNPSRDVRINQRSESTAVAR